MDGKLTEIRNYDESTALSTIGIEDKLDKLTSIDEKLGEIANSVSKEPPPPGVDPAALAVFDAMKAAGEAKGAQLAAPWHSAAASLVVPDAVVGAPGSIFQISFGEFGTLDCDPGHSESFLSTASWVKTLLIWVINCAFLLAVFKSIEGYVQQIGATNQGIPPIKEVVGVPIGQYTAIAFCIVIAGVIGVFTAKSIGFINDHKAFLGVHPLASAPGAVVYLVNFFLPIEHFISMLVAYLAFRLTIGGWWILATTTVRFLFGG
jgi:hypothetical protein